MSADEFEKLLEAVEGFGTSDGLRGHKKHTDHCTFRSLNKRWIKDDSNGRAVEYNGTTKKTWGQKDHAVSLFPKFNRNSKE